jgi:hypothetical protein
VSDHPNHLAARASLNRLREAWLWLAGMAEPGPTVRVVQPRTPAQLAREARLVRAERADRLQILQSGMVLTGRTPAPVRQAILDAKVIALSTIADQSWIVSSALRNRPMLAFSQWGANDNQRFSAAWHYLRITLPLVEVDLAGEVGVALDHADRLARAAAGVGPDRRRVLAECPCCGRRSLEAEVSSPDHSEWTVRCSRPECRCRGIDCTCKIHSRYPGIRHVWPSKAFPMLARLLDAA